MFLHFQPYFYVDKVCLSEWKADGKMRQLEGNKSVGIRIANAGDWGNPPVGQRSVGSQLSQGKHLHQQELRGI